MTAAAKAYEFVQALSQGKEPPAPFSMAWGLHEGMRGATWTIITSDGTVKTNTIKPMRGPGPIQKPTEVGKLSPDELLQLAAVMCAMRFDMTEPPPIQPSEVNLPQVELAVSLPDDRFSVRCPSPTLESLYGVAEIGKLFGEIRKRFVT